MQPTDAQRGALVGRQVQDERGALLDIKLLARVGTRRVLLVLLTEATAERVARKSQRAGDTTERAGDAREGTRRETARLADGPTRVAQRLRTRISVQIAQRRRKRRNGRGADGRAEEAVEGA